MRVPMSEGSQYTHLFSFRAVDHCADAIIWSWMSFSRSLSSLHVSPELLVFCIIIHFLDLQLICGTRQQIKCRQQTTQKLKCIQMEGYKTQDGLEHNSSVYIDQWMSITSSWLCGLHDAILKGSSPNHAIKLFPVRQKTSWSTMLG